MENRLAQGVLSGEFQEHDHVIADVNNAGDGLALREASGAEAEGERELAGVV